jgi:hypothetical protein
MLLSIEPLYSLRALIEASDEVTMRLLSIEPLYSLRALIEESAEAS